MSGCNVYGGLVFVLVSCIYVCMYVCMHVCMHAWMDGWMDDGCLHGVAHCLPGVCICSCLHGFVFACVLYVADCGCLFLNK